MMKDSRKVFRALRVRSLVAAALFICFSTNAFSHGTGALTNGSSGSVTGTAYLRPTVLVATSTTVSSSANPSVFGQSVTFTATVSTAGAGTPTGTVQFFDGANPVGGSVALNASGQAQTTTAGLSIGNHTISAVYSGDVPNGFDPSSGNLIGNPQVVNKANTTTGITFFPSNPSGTGQTITFTATVNASAPSLGTPTGSVTFSRNGSPVCSNVALNASRQANCNITFTIAGNYNITAQYGGSGNFNVSSSASPHVQQVLGPTAADISISGRVVTEFGRGVSSATIGLIGVDGETRYTWTNTLGYYKFADVPAGFYVVTFSARGYRTVWSNVMGLDSVTDLNIVLRR